MATPSSGGTRRRPIVRGNFCGSQTSCGTSATSAPSRAAAAAAAAAAASEEAVPPTEEELLMAPSPMANPRAGTPPRQSPADADGQGRLLERLQQSIDKCNKRYLFVNQKFNADMARLQARVDVLEQAKKAQAGQIVLLSSRCAKKQPSARMIAAALFDAADTDRSGFMEEAEGCAFMGMLLDDASEQQYYWQDMLRAHDQNKDGKISKDEFLTYALGDEELNSDGTFADKETEQQMIQRLADQGGEWPEEEEEEAQPDSAQPEPEQQQQEEEEEDDASIDDDVVAKVAELLPAHPDNICLSTFDPAYYSSLSEELKPSFLKCLASGIDNPDSGMGIYACQPDDYDRFKPFFSKALAKYHKVAEDAKHVNDWSLDGVVGLPADGQLDIAKLGLPALSMRVRTGRNLKDFPLPGAMTKEQRCELENRMLQAFEVLFADPAYGGRYCSFTPGHPNFVDEAEYQALVDAHIAFKDMSEDKYLLSAGIAAHWPYGRGVYVSADKGFIIWVGEEDHLRIMCMKKGTLLNEVFDRLKGALDVVNGIESIGGFAISPDYGVVTSCPTNLGTAMRASLHIQLPALTADGTDAKAKEICKPLGLSVRGLGGEHTPIGADGTVDISPSARFCITEAQIVTALYKGIEQLKAAEDRVANVAAKVTRVESAEAPKPGNPTLTTSYDL
jgi:protein-arginine kinase/Ca2+-binding EF-hand superfamily protein